MLHLLERLFLFTVSTEGSLLHTQTLTVVNIQHTSGKEYVGILLFINFFFFFSMLLNLPTSRCRLIFSSHYKSSWIGWKNLFILSSLRSADIPCLLRWKKLTELQSQFLFEMLCRVMLLLENSIQSETWRTLVQFQSNFYIFEPFWKKSEKWCSRS